MSTGIEQLQAELGERYSPKTVREYIKQARHFFAFAGDKDTYERHEILAYFDHLLKEGKGQATLDMAWFVSKAICRAKSIPFPCREGFKGDQPRSRKINSREVEIDGEGHDVSGPTPEYDEIAALIAWAIENGDPRQKAYLALSTVYAMRAIEISLVNKKDDIVKSRLFVRTAKFGQPKWHQIPPEVLKAIKGYKYPHLDEQAIWSAFQAMRKAAGLVKATALTPHGIRRWLNTYFTNREDLNPYVWYDFARWSRGRGDMMARYRHASSQEVDRIIFKLHPLLPLWAGSPREENDG
jgi:integrase